MTPDFGKHSISPESSDGFASVGTILPKKEEAALLPGSLFALTRFHFEEMDFANRKINQLNLQASVAM